MGSFLCKLIMVKCIKRLVILSVSSDLSLNTNINFLTRRRRRRRRRRVRVTRAVPFNDSKQWQWQRWWFQRAANSATVCECHSFG